MQHDLHAYAPWPQAPRMLLPAVRALPLRTAASTATYPACLALQQPGQSTHAHAGLPQTRHPGSQPGSLLGGNVYTKQRHCVVAHAAGGAAAAGGSSQGSGSGENAIPAWESSLAEVATKVTNLFPFWVGVMAVS